MRLTVKRLCSWIERARLLESRDELRIRAGSQGNFLWPGGARDRILPTPRIPSGGQTAGGMDFGTLRVTTPDGQVREYPLDSATVYIGRAEGNGVVIDHVSVSRRHAQLSLSGGETAVTDLGSATGTFVGGQRIPSSQPTPVTQGQSLRFGDAEARFIGVETEAPAAPGGGGAGPASRGVETQAPFTVTLRSPAEPVAAGSSTTATIVIQNRSAAVDEYTITVPDVPADWVRIARPLLALVPEARDELTIVIQPPKSAASKAGEQPLTVAVMSREHKREVRVLGNFNIRTFEEVELALKPARGKGPFSVTLSNAGNTPVSYELEASEDGDGAEMTFAVAEERVDLQPGENKNIVVNAKLKARKWTGYPFTRAFKVEAKPVSGARERKTARAALQVNPPLQRWRYFVFTILALTVGAVSIYSVPRVCTGGLSGCFSGGGSDKADPAPTATAAPVSPTAGANTPAPVAGLANGVMAKVVNSPTGTACLAVRREPTRQSDANIITRICNDKVVKIVSDRTESEGFIFWQIDDGAGLVGWAAEGLITGGDRFLVPAN